MRCPECGTSGRIKVTRRHYSLRPGKREPNRNLMVMCVACKSELQYVWRS
jgi:hypothetical protein